MQGSAQVSEQRDEHKQLADLVKHIEAVFDTETVHSAVTQVLDRLLQGTKREISIAARQSLLLYRGDIAGRRDEEWARVMAQIFLDSPGAETPSMNPYDLRDWMVAKQQMRERSIFKSATEDGFATGWKAGLNKGTAFGWGGAAAGKPREDVLKASENIRP